MSGSFAFCQKGWVSLLFDNPKGIHEFAVLSRTPFISNVRSCRECGTYMSCCSPSCLFQEVALYYQSQSLVSWWLAAWWFFYSNIPKSRQPSNQTGGLTTNLLYNKSAILGKPNNQPTDDLSETIKLGIKGNMYHSAAHNIQGYSSLPNHLTILLMVQKSETTTWDV